jgi:hypothetical protein
MPSNKHTKADEVLASIEQIQPVAAPNFFYTRLQAKMSSSLPTTHKSNFGTRPYWMVTCLTIFLMLNLITINHFSNKAKHPSKATKEATIDDFAAAYQLEHTTF